MNKDKISVDAAEAMQASIIDPSGVNYGPCNKPCSHRDCAWQRDTAARACCLCGNPIGFGRLFYEHEGDVAHRDCIEERSGNSTSPAPVH